MKTIICSFILFFNMIGYVCADASLWSLNDDFIENNQLDEGNTDYSSNIDLHAELKVEPIFEIENNKNSLSEVDFTAQDLFFEQSTLQKNLAKEHDKETTNYSILSHKFYENDRVKIFNYTAYNIQQLKNTLLNPSNENISENELFLSFGYGLEFKINDLNKIGYEYISSFPYDRGQLFRLFWVRTLTAY